MVRGGMRRDGNYNKWNNALENWLRWQNNLGIFGNDIIITIAMTNTNANGEWWTANGKYRNSWMIMVLFLLGEWVGIPIIYTIVFSETVSGERGERLHNIMNNKLDQMILCLVSIHRFMANQPPSQPIRLINKWKAASDCLTEVISVSHRIESDRVGSDRIHAYLLPLANFVEIHWNLICLLALPFHLSNEFDSKLELEYEIEQTSFYLHCFFSIHFHFERATNKISHFILMMNETVSKSWEVDYLLWL